MLVLAEQRGHRVTLVRNLMAKLRNRELAQAAKANAAEIGLEHRVCSMASAWRAISRRSIMLASRCYSISISLM
jgi:PP-loop superfamily ATP-utilizing enzyme